MRKLLNRFASVLRSGRSLAVAGGAVALGGLASQANAAAYAIPAELQPSAVADAAFGIITPFIPVMIAIGVTLMITLVVYSVITRKVWHFGNVA